MKRGSWKIIKKTAFKDERPNGVSSSKNAVDVIESTLRKVFGEESIAAIEAQFDDVYRLSFNDNSIIENPDKFAEAIQYAFGASSTLIMAEINRKLAEMLGLDLRSNSELIESASYGFITLMSKMRNEIPAIE